MRQAYQGGTFIGIHVHKLLKVDTVFYSHLLLLQTFVYHPESIDVLRGNIIGTAQDNPSLQESAESVGEKFTALLRHFTKCRNGYNSSSFMNEKIKELGMCSKSALQKCLILYPYLYSQRRTSKHSCHFTEQPFPDATVLPKMHILEEHTIPWLQRWHLGSGLMELNLFMLT